MHDLSGKKGFIFDLDGVVYIGKTPIEGARETLAHIREIGGKVRFLTNNAADSRDYHVRKLGSMGICCEINEVITSSQGVAIYLKDRYGTGKCFVIGEEGFVGELRQQGFRVVEGKEGERADFVAVGVDSGFTYEKLTIALRAVKNGARFIAANPDVSRPGEEGLDPAAGAMIAALEAASGVKPEVVIGKPNPMLFEIAVKGMGLRRNQVATVGDRIDTDIVGGNRFNLYTILVLTGITKRGDLRGLKGEERPKLVLDSVADLKGLL
ncbi:MAG: HAD-IIA family hydrolase [Candidatus Micrarchaeota archaeon]|nr:HAD-IIA family hydrolase [Candidatus Micrarchaeota archaeon]